MTSSEKLPIAVIACQVFKDLLAKYLPVEILSQVTYLDYGLHRTPSNLTTAIQQAVDSIQEPSLIILGYGLCGNGLDGVTAGTHTLLVARADDCIAILLGSYRAYRDQFDSAPGTYYLTKGWLESGSNPLQEFNEYQDKYGTETAAWLVDQQYHNYRRVAFVAHHPDELERYRSQALEVAHYCERWGMRYEEILGSEAYIQRLVEVAQALELVDQEFVMIPPGGVLNQSHFIR